MACAARILTSTDWPQMKALRLEAVRLNPSVFYLTLDQEKAAPDSEWEKRCIERANDGCGFGLFDGEKLVGSVELLTQPGRQPGEVVLGRLYIDEDYRKDGNLDKLVGTALEWASRQDKFMTVITAMVIGNPSSWVTAKFGFAEARLESGALWTDTFVWPSSITPECPEGKKVTQKWFAHVLPQPRPRLVQDVIAAREAGKPSV